MRYTSTEDVEIKNMGKIGDGLFAKNNIPANTVVGVCGGTIVYSFGNLPPNLNPIYQRSCTSEAISNSSSNGAYYKYSSIFGTGACAADKIQHTFSPNPKLQKVLTQKEGLENNIAYPNTDCIGIKTPYNFDIDLLVANRPIKAGEIFLTNYGERYVFGRINNNMSPQSQRPNESLEITSIADGKIINSGTASCP